MIVRSILVFAALSMAYALVIPYAPSARKGLQGGSQWEKNSIKQESVLFGETEQYDVILLGSSIAANIVDIPDHWLNLGMPSRSSIDGAELLVAADIEPRLVIIEANHFNTGTDSISKASNWNPRRYFEAFLTQNKPSHLLLRLLGRLAGIDSGTVASSSLTDNVNKKIYEKVLSKRQKLCAVEMDDQQLADRSIRLESAVKKLNEQGFKIVFVEIPEASETFESVRRTQFRKRFKEMFPDSEFGWFDSFDPSEFKTRDAVHLAPASNKRFTDLLIDFVNSKS